LINPSPQPGGAFWVQLLGGFGPEQSAVPVELKMESPLPPLFVEVLEVFPVPPPPVLPPAELGAPGSKVESLFAHPFKLAHTDANPRIVKMDFIGCIANTVR
jgi:hypothetical protein